MAYIPSCPVPYMTAVDLSAGKKVAFSCLINPRDRIKGYTVKIKSISSGDVILSNSEIFQTPLCGNANNDCYLNIDITVPEATDYNGKDYSWCIELVDDDYEEVKYGGYTGKKGFLLQDYRSSDEQNAIIDCILCVDGKFYTITGFENTGIVCCEPKELFEKEAWAWAEAHPNSDPNAKMYLYKNKATSPEYYFKARSTPDITLDVPQNIPSNVINISASYKQKEHTKPAYYCFSLYNNEDDIVHTTGNLVSANMSYSYEGLIDKQNYTLELKVVDDDSVETIVSKSFTVKYDMYDTFIEPRISNNSHDTYIKVDYSQYVQIDGVLEGCGDVKYTKFKSVNDAAPQNYNGVNLSYGQNLYWNERSGGKPLNLEKIEYLVHWNGNEGFSGNIFEKIDGDTFGRNIRVGFNGKSFYYTLGYLPSVEITPYETELTAISTTDITPIENTWYCISDTMEIKDSDYIIENDLTSKYWWLFEVTEDNLIVKKSEKYLGTVVSA